MCQKFPKVKEYYKAQAGDLKDIVKTYKDIIEKKFYGHALKAGCRKICGISSGPFLCVFV
ncbi:MAG: hypothetical protein DRI57_10680 [Deltaproteobacteria bacterium]|nr:MAG: hypothetical protein DRI57_10680 [Deltaproteobacteria bacterium]